MTVEIDKCCGGCTNEPKSTWEGTQLRWVWWQEGVLSKSCWQDSEDEWGQRRERALEVLYEEI